MIALAHTTSVAPAARVTLPEPAADILARLGGGAFMLRTGVRAAGARGGGLVLILPATMPRRGGWRVDVFMGRDGAARIDTSKPLGARATRFIGTERGAPGEDIRAVFARATGVPCDGR